MSQPSLDEGNQRPNVLCNPSSGVGPHASALTGQSMFNSSCFAVPGLEQPGNAPRYFSNLRTDGIHNVDMSISKTFVLREDIKLELRGEFFNLFNHAQFGNPNPDINAGTQFGVINSTVGNPRVIQFALKFIF